MFPGDEFACETGQLEIDGWVVGGHQAHDPRRSLVDDQGTCADTGQPGVQRPAQRRLVEPGMPLAAESAAPIGTVIERAGDGAMPGADAFDAGGGCGALRRHGVPIDFGVVVPQLRHVWPICDATLRLPGSHSGGQPRETSLWSGTSRPVG